MDLGQDRRGVDMGPSAIRYARLQAVLEELGYPVADLGNAGVPIPEVVGKKEEVKHLGVVRDVCAEVASRAGAMVSEGFFPVFLGGDHSVDLGTVSGVSRGRSAVPAAACSVATHPDFTTPQTPPPRTTPGVPRAALKRPGHTQLVCIGGGGASMRPEDVVI